MQNRHVSGKFENPSMKIRTIPHYSKHSQGRAAIHVQVATYGTSYRITLVGNGNGCD